jgi:hypothetical protein
MENHPPQPNPPAFQDGLCIGNGIPAANKDIPLEVHISGWRDHQNGKKCSVETLNKLSLSRDLCKKPFLKKHFYMLQSIICI